MEDVGAEVGMLMSTAGSLIPLTLAEIRHLFNLADHDEGAIDHGLHWSRWRRRHQAEARWHHFRRRLRLQTLIVI